MRRSKSISALCLSTILMATPTFAQETDPVAARQQANSAYSNSEFTRCGELFEQAAHRSAGRIVMSDFYNAACCYSLANKLDKAFEMLNLAAQAGYANINNLKGDSDFNHLRADPRWEKFLATVAVPPIQITKNFTTDPKNAPFVYEDAERFLSAMKLVDGGASIIPTLQEEYLDKGSPGLKQFITKYGLTAEAIVQGIEKHPKKYQQISARLAQIKNRESALRASYITFKRVVPQAVFPPTYFLVSDYGGVASGSPDGQLITIERRTEESVDRMETLLTHELLHFQQLNTLGPDDFYSLFGDKKVLLGLAIREGTAEFVAQQITGRITQDDAYAYLLEHEAEVWQEFQSQMLTRETKGWMWSSPENPEQPRDMAYAIGARIIEAYYRQAPDKTKAMQEILAEINHEAFLKQSGYNPTK